MADKGPFVPKYKLVFDDLVKRIRQGEFADGERLPRERELCDQYQVKRVTVRRALELLDQQGAAEKRPGLGTYVRIHGKDAAAQGDTIIYAMRRNQNDIRHNVNAFNAMLFFVLEQACHERGLRLHYVGLENGDDAELTGPHVLAVMLVSYHEQGTAARLWAKGTPVICVNHWEEGVVSLLPDNFCGIRHAVHHLAALGHEHIGYISGPLANTNAEERLMGYRFGVQEKGLSAGREDVVWGSWTMESGREAMLRLMAQKDRPTAVIAASDMMAIGAIDAANKLGLRVPEEVSIMGFDNIDMGLYCAPPLTTVSLSVQELARLAVEAAVRAASTPADSREHYTVRLPTDIAARGSVAERAGRAE